MNHKRTVNASEKALFRAADFAMHSSYGGEIEYAEQHKERLMKAEKIPLEDIKRKSVCGKEGPYAERGIFFLYNEDDELLCTHILFGKDVKGSSLFQIVKKHKCNADFTNGWYNELAYAKYLPCEHYDPMDLIMLSIGFSQLTPPKYRRSHALSPCPPRIEASLLRQDGEALANGFFDLESDTPQEPVKSLTDILSVFSRREGYCEEYVLRLCDDIGSLSGLPEATKVEMAEKFAGTPPSYRDSLLYAASFYPDSYASVAKTLLRFTDFRTSDSLSPRLASARDAVTAAKLRFFRREEKKVLLKRAMATYKPQSTKKQRICLAGELVTLFFGPSLVWNTLGNEKPILSFSLLVLLFGIAVGCLIAVVRDSRKQYLATKAIYSASIDRKDILTNWMHSAQSASLDTDCSKTNYLLAALYNAARLQSAAQYYSLIDSFSFEDAATYLSRLPVSSELKTFISDVLAKGLVSPAISRFEPELHDLIIALACGEPIILPNKRTVTLPSGKKRFTIKKDYTHHRCYVAEETWVNTPFIGSHWNTVVFPTGYTLAEAERERDKRVSESLCGFDSDAFHAVTPYPAHLRYFQTNVKKYKNCGLTGDAEKIFRFFYLLSSRNPEVPSPDLIPAVKDILPVLSEVLPADMAYIAEDLPSSADYDLCYQRNLQNLFLFEYNVITENVYRRFSGDKPIKPMENGFSIAAENLYFPAPGENDLRDCCLRGDVTLKIGESTFAFGDATVSATALYLLKSLTENHIACEQIQLVPHCGFNWYRDAENENITIDGCGNGIRLSVLHDGDRMIIVTEEGRESAVSYADYEREVFAFADSVENFYKSSPERLFDTADLRLTYTVFWKEWQRRRHNS